MRMTERSDITSLPFQMWLDADRSHEAKLTDERLAYVYEDYIDWADVNDIEKPMSKSSFLNKAKKYLADNNLENRFARKGYIRRGSTETYIETDKLTANNFDRMLNIPYQEKQEQIAAYTKMVTTDVANSAYFYGPPGTGKSTIVKQALDDIGFKAVWYKGAVKNVESFVREVLYPNRQGEVIVLDDFNFLKSKDITEIVKAATENVPVRLISWVSDKKTTQKEAIPTTFEFSSGIIIISNEGVNSAIDDRSLSVNYDFDKYTMIAMMGDHLADFMPQVDLSIKKEVLDFLATAIQSDDIRRISWRDFNTCVVNKLARPYGDMWKRWSTAFLLQKGARQGKKR